MKRSETATPLERWTIGRASSCDYVIPHAGVSGKHAELLRVAPEQFVLRDLGSTNGTYIGRTGERITEIQLRGDEVLFFSTHFCVPFAVLRQQLLAGNANAQGRQLELLKEVLRIGRAPDNDICLAPLTVSRHHAEIRRLSAGELVIRDLGTKLGTVVDGQLIKGEDRPITPDSSIWVGGCRISLDLTDGVGRQTKVAVDRTGFDLRLSHVGFAPVGEPTRALLDDICMAVSPGELVALMGPSGCGKSTLLNVLIGEAAPYTGSVTFDGIEVSDSPGLILPFVAHVPQDDFLNPDLTVRETLRCYARLRLPSDLSDEEIDAKIDDVCGKLGLFDLARQVDLRDRLIGSSERKGLSGGQKKRVSMAMELLSDPRILFLDEPTSGLSSYDTRLVIEQLRMVSTSAGVAIVVTIHQPSLQVFRRFDSVLYLKSGKLAYYGPTFPQAVAYFCPKDDPEVIGPDGVMEVLDSSDAVALSQSFAQSPMATRFVWSRLEGAPVRAARLDRVTAPAASSLIMQARAILLRDVVARGRQTGTLLVLAGQPLMIGILIGQLFHNPSAAETITVAFLLPLVSFWFGLNNAVRELVCERTLFRRERRGGLSPLAYLSARFAVLGGICLLQVFALVALLELQLPELTWNFLLSVSLAFLTSLVGAAWGLVVSAFAVTQVAAVTAIPLVLIPVILLGGYVKPYQSSLADVFLSRVLADAIPVRWGFEGYCSLFNAVGLCFSSPQLITPLLVLGFALVGGVILVHQRLCRAR